MKTNKKCCNKKSPNIHQYQTKTCANIHGSKILEYPYTNQFVATFINSYHIFHIYTFSGQIITCLQSQYTLCIRLVYFVEHLKSVIEFLWTNKEKGHPLFDAQISLELRRCSFHSQISSNKTVLQSPDSE